MKSKSLSQTDQERKNIVLHIIRTLRGNKQRFSKRQYEVWAKKNPNERGEQCGVTGLYFLGEMGKETVWHPDYPTIWFGLWLDCKLRIKYEAGDCDDFVVYPRWLAEAIMEETDIKINEKDIYDNDEETITNESLSVAAKDFSDIKNVFFIWNKLVYAVVEVTDDFIRAQPFGEVTNNLDEIKLSNKGKIEYFNPATPVFVIDDRFEYRRW